MNNKPKFSPGPWRYAYEGSGDYCVYHGNEEIGTCWSKDSHFMGLGPKAFENEANAKLISAAPEMYEALAAVRGYMATDCKDWGNLYLKVSNVLGKVEADD